MSCRLTSTYHGSERAPHIELKERIPADLDDAGWQVPLCSGASQDASAELRTWSGE
jgi:hypothetical protein